ncbi:hypothetical protein COT50_00490 [candidate division WWE3 bacterium CG08_land_8_20_14_0_20_41_10]|uniref:BrnT family toxin n=1 Tax=candidate division WWE3 bacterium CG08_land_8_20_14_0_20_41_10 TaxID=1975085 RepID=A0A2H0XCY7_UNCKA|nr:MAG: hypothetical protein COT50_00490 [candidate division WWE3 bacterium CG08_land_8_20_14_0_20_41_10]
MNLPVPLAFDWDKGNMEKNSGKHQVMYKEAEEVFFNRPIRIFRDISHSQEEDRFVALGITDKKRTLSMAFTIRSSKIRIISARDQSHKERKIYEQEKIDAAV